jgi:hypothetical protein
MLGVVPGEEPPAERLGILVGAELGREVRGCVGAVLYTINFQAPGFYERQGYRVLGTVPCLPPGASRIFMTKPLA